jgi:hypothetical protein
LVIRKAQQQIILVDNKRHKVILKPFKIKQLKGAFMKSLVITLLFAALMAAGCSSTTTIRSVPSGANLYIDGSMVGKTPYTYSDTKIVGSSTTLRLKKDGFEEANLVMSRSEEFDAGACAGGVFVLVPFLWIEKYKAEHVYELVASKGHDKSDDGSKDDSDEKPAKKSKKKKSEKSDSSDE